MPGTTQHLFYNDIMGTPPARARQIAGQTIGSSTRRRRGRWSSPTAIFALGIGLFLLLLGLGTRGEWEVRR